MVTDEPDLSHISILSIIYNWGKYNLFFWGSNSILNLQLIKKIKNGYVTCAHETLTNIVAFCTIDIYLYKLSLKLNKLLIMFLFKVPL